LSGTGNILQVEKKMSSSINPDEEILRRKVFEALRPFFEYKHTRKFIPGESVIPASGKVFDIHEMINLVDASMDFWLTTGRYADEFEQKLAQRLQLRHAVLTNSGSSANLLATSALTSPELGEQRLKPGDEVITVAASFPTTVNPIVQHGAIPVFLDIDIPTYTIRASEIEGAMTEKTRAIMVAHTLGNPFDLDTVMRISKKHHLFVVEDSCDALGSTYRGKPVGSFGDLATFSFYPAHHITMGEGGAVVTNSSKLKTLVESFRDWGRDCWCDPGKDNTCGKRFGWQLGDLPFGYDHKYTYSHLGYNLKATDMQAAVGVAQLDKLDQFIAARKRNFELLYKGLNRFEEFLILPEATPYAEPSWFGFVLTVREDAPFQREALTAFLESRKIVTRLLFAGNIVKQPYFKALPYRIVGDLKQTDIIMQRSFWIGVYPGITEEMVEYVVDQFAAFFAKV
jgi:CDP-4-dehydro-6-deoxyglucose reductase, E1